jgi:hypothetical protein
VRRGYGDQRDRGYFVSLDRVKVDANAGRYRGLGDGDAGYAWFDYCFNCFQDGGVVCPVGQAGVQRDQQPRPA